MNKATTVGFRKGANTALVTALAIALLVIFLAPFLFMVFTSMKNQTQIATVGSPIWPAVSPKFEYNGKSLDIFTVPLPDGTTKE